jgi:hypothetical protein
MNTNDPELFRVWGSDHIAYGPVELPTLVSWVQEGRVLPQTWIYVETADAWSRARQVTELKGLSAMRSAEDRGAPAPEPRAACGLKPGSLRRIKVLAEMDERLLASFAQYLEVIKFRQFAEVVRRGDPSDAMYMILEGELRARVLIDGKESTLSTLTVGESFGELALLDSGPRSADVLANMDSTCLRLSTDSLELICREAPALATPFLKALSRSVCTRMRGLTKRYEDSVHFAYVGQAAG